MIRSRVPCRSVRAKAGRRSRLASVARSAKEGPPKRGRVGQRERATRTVDEWANAAYVLPLRQAWTGTRETDGFANNSVEDIGANRAESSRWTLGSA